MADKIKYIKLLVLAQLMDLLTTVVLIGFLGGWEINPFMRNLTLLQMALIKIVVIALVVPILYRHKKLPLWSYVLLFYISALPVAWNILVIGVEIFVKI